MGAQRSNGRDYSAAEKLAEVEFEIMRCKRAIRKREAAGTPVEKLQTRLHIMRAIARDYQAKIDGSTAS